MEEIILKRALIVSMIEIINILRITEDMTIEVTPSIIMICEDSK